MNEMTTIEKRGLQAISTPSGKIVIVAADQRNSMKAVVQDTPGDTSAITVEELAAIKADLVRHLANHAPAILLDPEIALPQIVDDGILARDTALVVGLDASGFALEDGLRYTSFVPGMSVAGGRRYGADVLKMLYYTRPDLQPFGSRVWSQVRDLITECEKEGILLIVELLTYQVEDESDEDYQAAFADLVIDGARLAVAAGAKLLKLQYPGSAQGCRAVTEAAQGVPWAVLSAGVDHETFVKQVGIAVSEGCAGAMAGRAIWKDSLSFDADTRKDLLTNRALPRLVELSSVVNG
jgi:tagatose 1,6-diphosphate aldolase